MFDVRFHALRYLVIQRVDRFCPIPQHLKRFLVVNPFTTFAGILLFSRIRSCNPIDCHQNVLHQALVAMKCIKRRFIDKGSVAIKALCQRMNVLTREVPRQEDRFIRLERGRTFQASPEPVSQSIYELEKFWVNAGTLRLKQLLPLTLSLKCQLFSAKLTAT